MRKPASRPVAAVTALVVLLGTSWGCATTQLPPISAAGDSFEPLPDERRLWQRAREEERKLLDEVDLYEDPLLEDYLEDVAGRLQPAGMAANPAVHYRVRVIDDPTLNAFAYPHGSLFVHTGLLARMQSEDELATVLGHEMTHVENRHMIRFHRAARNRQIGWTVAAVAAAVVLAGEEAEAYEEGDWSRGARIGVLSDVFIGLGLQLAVLASVNGYGRDLELEADRGGFAKLAAAGYDPDAAPAVYQALLDDHGEGASGAGAFFFASHPKLANRLESAGAWAETRPASDGVAPAGEPDEFVRRIRPVVRHDARANLEAGRLALAEEELQRVLAWMPTDPVAHELTARLRFAQADAAPEGEEARRLEDEGEDALREAVRLDPQRPGPHRELGLLAYRQGDFRTACIEFRHYLDADPDAPDAGRVRDYLLELERDGWCV
ncbi:MAG: tetratricopeptide repeat protein [Thermoanaerobaculia bacterium]